MTTSFSDPLASPAPPRPSPCPDLPPLAAWQLRRLNTDSQRAAIVKMVSILEAAARTSSFAVPLLPLEAAVLLRHGEAFVGPSHPALVAQFHGRVP